MPEGLRIAEKFCAREPRVWMRHFICWRFRAPGGDSVCLSDSVWRGDSFSRRVSVCRRDFVRGMDLCCVNHHASRGD